MERKWRTEHGQLTGPGHKRSTSKAEEWGWGGHREREQESGAGGKKKTENIENRVKIMSRGGMS